MVGWPWCSRYITGVVFKKNHLPSTEVSNPPIQEASSKVRLSLGSSGSTIHPWAEKHTHPRTFEQREKAPEKLPKANRKSIPTWRNDQIWRIFFNWVETTNQTRFIWGHTPPPPKFHSEFSPEQWMVGRRTILSYWVFITFQGRLLLNFGRVEDFTFCFLVKSHLLKMSIWDFRGHLGKTRPPFAKGLNLKKG